MPNASYKVTLPDGRALRITAPSTEAAYRSAQEWLRDNPFQPGLRDRAAAFTSSFVRDIPVIGEPLYNATAGLADQVRERVGGQTPEQNASARQQMEARNAAQPMTQMAGSIAGNTAALVPFMASFPAAFGMKAGVPMLPRMAASGASSGAISGADSMVRTGDVGQAAMNVVSGGGLGMLLPPAGDLLTGAAQGLFHVGSGVRGMWNPQKEAARRVATAKQIDARSGPTLSAADELAASRNGQPIYNVDRGGETTRALARSAANTSPEIRGGLNKIADDRFAGQASRAMQRLSRIVGGRVDDITFHETLLSNARLANAPAYKAAYTAGDRPIRSPLLERMMGSPDIVDAMKKAVQSGKTRAIADGQGAFNTAATITPDGRLIFRPGPNGVPTFPNLQFWDYTYRNLRDQGRKLTRTGATDEGNAVTTLAHQLRNELDNLVPQYQTARQGAAAFFGADDALDAGKNFARNRRLTPEAQRAFNGMKPAEQDAFRVGYTSELMDTLRAAPDRTNVIRQVFGNPAAREMNQTIFGQAKAAELEAFVRVEHVMDQLRGALGNSTTARQLQEMGMAGGIGAAGGFTLSGGDYNAATQGASLGLLTSLGMRGAQMAGTRINADVLQRVGRLLLDPDPSAINTMINQATFSPAYISALEAISTSLSALSRGAVQATQQPGQPQFVDVPQAMVTAQ